MNSDEKGSNETLRELITGIVIFGVVCFVIGCFFVHSILLYGVGLLTGILLAVFSAWHMNRSIWINLSIHAGDEGGATAYARKQSLIRYGIILAVFFVICITNIGYPLAAFLGIMGLKAGAYLQPFIHRLGIRR